MNDSKKAVILVGHGGLPSDIPSEMVEQFMRVHKGRVKSGGPITEHEIQLDTYKTEWCSSYILDKLHKILIYIYKI